jgi:transposase
VFGLSPGNAHDAPEGRKLLDKILCDFGCDIVMDKAYEGDDTRQKAMEQGFVPVVPPKSNRKTPWEYDRELYKRRNEIERYFLRLKRFRRVFTRYDKLDIIYTGVIICAMLFDAILM